MSDFPLPKKKNSRIFTKYFALFAGILFLVLFILGGSLLIFVNQYWQQDKTRLMSENTQSVASTAESMLQMDDMNTRYSLGKGLLCGTLDMISTSSDADIFICDVSGAVILCKERADTLPLLGSFQSCEKHDSLVIASSLLQSVYEGRAIGKGLINGEQYYIVGHTIERGGQIIGYVFATTPTGINALTSDIVKIFALSAVICLSLAYVGVYFITKHMTDPLLQMSKAAKESAEKYAGYDKNLAELQAKVKGYETDSVKTRIALEAGLPYTMASRLCGESEEDIRADARSLASLMGAGRTEAAPLHTGEPAGGSSKRDALRALNAQLNDND